MSGGAPLQAWRCMWRELQGALVPASDPVRHCPLQAQEQNAGHLSLKTLQPLVACSVGLLGGSTSWSPPPLLCLLHPLVLALVALGTSLSWAGLSRSVG